jgi:IclR family transcriptional regulator, pca regulon regulatory protein
MGGVLPKDPLNVASVEKAFRVLEAFGQSTDEMRLSDIVAATGLDKSAAQRFAHSLWQAGYLEKNERTRHFRLGKRILDLSFFYLRSNPLIEAATPALVELRRACGERVNLSLFDDLTLIYAIRQQSKREYFHGTLIGRRVPVFSSAGGRAVLACLPDDRVADILARSDLTPFTPRTITDPAVLWQKVAEARETGYGLAVEETVAGEIIVGVAVTDTEGAPVAAVHIAGSVADWTPEQFAARFAPLAMETAQSLSRSRTIAPARLPGPSKLRRLSDTAA